VSATGDADAGPPERQRQRLRAFGQYEAAQSRAASDRRIEGMPNFSDTHRLCAAWEWNLV
jgi:hypothetical protein